MASSSVPAYRHRKDRNQAVVTISGRDHYLGRYGSPASIQKYDRLIAEWLERGRTPEPRDAVTVVEIADLYLAHAKSYYVKDGAETSELSVIKVALRPLLRLYADLPAAEFGPRRLAAVRDAFVAHGWTRKTINTAVRRVRGMFRWACEREYIPAEIHHRLLALRGLRRNQQGAPEGQGVRPALVQHVDALEGHVSAQVWAMIRLQLLTGMRPGEVTMMRPIDIKTEGDVWLYEPHAHKTQHHGKKRVVDLGPLAQAVLTPFLARAVDDYCFSPKEAEAERSKRRREARQTKVQPSQRNRGKGPKRRRAPRDRYDVISYRQAVHRACATAGVPRWSPNQLRHTRATELRRQFGIEVAQICLGHSL